MKILLINGSPRMGNTDLILNKIKEIDCNKV
jgi:multimeric flavodoxin WrbA